MKKENIQHIKFAVLAVDTVVFTIRDGNLLVRLVNVNRPPHFENILGIPGGLIRPEETAEETAKRMIEDKAGIRPSVVHTEQLYTFSKINRDPRGRVVAVAYLGLVSWDELSTSEREDSADVRWVSVLEVPKLAYDHNEVLSVARARLESRVTYTTLIQKVLPEEFTLTELENAYEVIIGEDVDKRNFRKKMGKLGLLKDTGHERRGEAHRPAKLYSFINKRVEPMNIM